MHLEHRFWTESYDQEIGDWNEKVNSEDYAHVLVILKNSIYFKRSVEDASELSWESSYEQYPIV